MKKSGRGILLMTLMVLLTLLLAVPCSAAVKNGLKTENGKIHYYTGGKLAKKRWVTVKGKKYYFDSKGNALTGSGKVSGTYYVFNTKGVLQTGTKTRIITVAKKKYRVNKNGSAAKGWSDSKGKTVKKTAKSVTYYFKANGQAATGINFIGGYSGKFYQFSKEGKLSTAKTRKLQSAAKENKSFATLKKLLGKYEKVFVDKNACLSGPKGQKAEYREYTYARFKVATAKYKGGEIFMYAFTD